MASTSSRQTSGPVIRVKRVLKKGTSSIRLKKQVIRTQRKAHKSVIKLLK